MNYPQQPHGQPGYGAPPPQQWGPPVQPMGYGMMYREYEFSEQDNATIRKVAMATKVLAAVQFVQAALALVSVNVIQVGINIAVGIALLGAGSALSSVATTQGTDIHHVMKAIDNLSTQFAIRIWATVIGFVLGLLVLALFVVLMGAAFSSMGGV